MAAFFLDTSAVVKRYVLEIGTAWVKGLTDPAAGHVLILARLTGVEVTSAVIRRLRGGHLAPAAASRILADFRLDFRAQYQILAITDVLLDAAVVLAERHALRGYDAVQLAVAAESAANLKSSGTLLTLISADLELNAAATAEGLTVDDPNNHP